MVARLPEIERRELETTRGSLRQGCSTSNMGPFMPHVSPLALSARATLTRMRFRGNWEVVWASARSF